MTRFALPIILFAACATDHPAEGPDAGAIANQGLDSCADEGVQLQELWNVDNLHGPMIALSIAPDGTAVVTTDDGAVKQWSLGATADAAPLPGGRPSYGDPFTEVGAVVRALAIGGGGDRVLGGDVGGALRQWSIPDAGDMGNRPLDGAPLAAVTALGDDAAVVADESFGGAMRVIPLDGGAAGEPFQTTLWNTTSLHAGAGALFTAGHNYGMAAIERRDPEAAGTPVDSWDTLATSGWVRDIELSADGDWLAAGGEFGLAVLAAGDLAAGPTAIVTAPTSTSIAFTASGDHLAAVTADGTVVIYDRALTAAIETITVPTPVAVAVDPSGERLVVASADGRLRAYSCR